MLTPIVIPEGHTRESMLACVEREIRMREVVYRKRVELGQMTEEKAAEEIASMRAVRAVLAQLPAAPPVQPGLFAEDRRDRT